MQLSLAMAERCGKFMFEIRPDLFPHGYLTDAEIDLWVKHFDNKPQRPR